MHSLNVLQNMFDFPFTFARSRRHETVFPRKGRNIIFCRAIKTLRSKKRRIQTGQKKKRTLCQKRGRKKREGQKTGAKNKRVLSSFSSLSCARARSFSLARRFGIELRIAAQNAVGLKSGRKESARIAAAAAAAAGGGCVSGRRRIGLSHSLSPCNPFLRAFPSSDWQRRKGRERERERERETFWHRRKTHLAKIQFSVFTSREKSFFFGGKKSCFRVKKEEEINKSASEREKRTLAEM